MRRLDDSYPVPQEDEASVLICLTRDPWVSSVTARDGRVTWLKLMLCADEAEGVGAS